MVVNCGQSKIKVNRKTLYGIYNKKLFQIKIDSTIYFKLKFKLIQTYM